MPPAGAGPDPAAAEVEDAGCERCGSAERLLLRRCPPWAWQRCSRCGHVYLAPRPPARAHARLLRAALSERVPEIEAAERREAPARRRWIEELRAGCPAGARVLEIGSRFGFLLADLRAAEFDAAGIEPSPIGCRFAERWLGVRPECVQAEEWEGPAGAFDVVLADEALERVCDLERVLTLARAWLRPSGRILVRWRVPLPAAADAPLRRRAFTTRTLDEALRAHGFADVDTQEDAWWKAARSGWTCARRP